MTLAHTTNADRLRQILDEDLVKAGSKFVHTNEDVAYFFYGVNFFKLNSHLSDAKTRPCGFLFRNESVEKAVRIFPFDSGACDAGMFGDSLPGGVMDYELPISDSTTPARLVELLYENNEGYIAGRPKPLDPSASVTEQKIVSFVLEATSKAQPENGLDDRFCGIEVQFTEEQEFKENVELLILPKNAYNHHLKPGLEKLIAGMPVEFYDDPLISGPLRDSQSIKQKAIDFLRTRNLGTLDAFK